MSKEEMSWFHCGKCGALFMSPMGEQQDRVCTECGRSPLVTANRMETHDAAVMVRPETAASSERRGKRVKGRSKKALVFKILFGWLLFMGVILLIGRIVWPAGQQAGPTAPVEDKHEMSDQLVVRANSQSVATAFQSFLTAATPEAKTQYVHDPIRMAGKIQRYYQYDSSSLPDLNSLNCIDTGVLHLPEGDTIETRWEHADGRIYQAFFRKEEGEWRLDWEDFVRYSDYPWVSFLKENSDSEGEFRLLARERTSRSESNTDSLNVVLYPSRPGYPEEVGVSSPHFVVARDSENGRILAKAFEMRSKDQPMFGSSLPDLEPAGMIRIRAKIRRVAGSAEPVFTLEKILASHWLDTTASGLPEGDAYSDKTDNR